MGRRRLEALGSCRGRHHHTAKDNWESGCGLNARLIKVNGFGGTRVPGIISWLPQPPQRLEPPGRVGVIVSLRGAGCILVSGDTPVRVLAPWESRKPDSASYGRIEKARRQKKISGIFFIATSKKSQKWGRASWPFLMVESCKNSLFFLGI